MNYVCSTSCTSFQTQKWVSTMEIIGTSHDELILLNLSPCKPLGTMGLLSWLSPRSNSPATSPATDERLTEKTQIILSNSYAKVNDYNSSSHSEDTRQQDKVDDEYCSSDYEPLALESPPSSLWKRYNSALDRNPVLVKSITAFFILGSGDLCAQTFEACLGTGGMDDTDIIRIDWPRASRFAAFGLFGAPWSHYYFHYLDHFLPPTDKPFTRTTLVKVCIDQGIQAPILLALMISILSLLKGEGFSGVRLDISQNYWNSLLANWKLWIPASFANLAFVAPRFRVLFVNVVFFVWTIILSMIINVS